MAPIRILYPDSFSINGGVVERDAAGDAAVEFDIRQARDAAEIEDAAWRGADALLTAIGCRIDDGVIARLDRCRIICRQGVGVDLIDLKAAGARGIPVCNVPDYGTMEVADHAIALLLSFTRGIVAYNQIFRDDPESGWDYLKAPMVCRMKGKTLGVIGLGRIGTAAALRAKAFDLNVACYDPHMPDGRELSLGIARHERLEDLLAASDFITIHAPGGAETRHMIDAAAVQAMKPGVILVNTARGTIVDLDAIYDGLRSGHIGAVGLDVLPQEPPPADHPLVAAWRRREPWLDNRCVFTPHAAFYSDVGLDFMRRKSVWTVLDYLRDGKLRNCLNLDQLRR